MKVSRFQWFTLSPFELSRSLWRQRSTFELTDVVERLGLNSISFYLSRCGLLEDIPLSYGYNRPYIISMSPWTT